MPVSHGSITGVGNDVNGVTITWSDGFTQRFNYADIPSNVRNRTNTEIEAWIDAWFDDRTWLTDAAGNFKLDDDGNRIKTVYVRSHVVQRPPQPWLIELRVAGDPIPAQWWTL